MNQRYKENSLNRKHKTQSALTGEGAIGRRAGDASLVPFGGNSSTTTDATPSSSDDLSEIDHPTNLSTLQKQTETVRLHELMAHPGVFQVLVFTGTLWKTHPESAIVLAKSMDHHLKTWRSWWSWTDDHNEDDEKAAALNRPFMVHTITTLTSCPFTEATKNPLTDKNAGDCKAYSDPKGELHRRYGVEATVKKGLASGGAIVVVRPDSHIAYRVQGLGESAWNDVNEYFESILVKRTDDGPSSSSSSSSS